MPGGVQSNDPLMHGARLAGAGKRRDTSAAMRVLQAKTNDRRSATLSWFPPALRRFHDAGIGAARRCYIAVTQSRV